ncbi:MULTISPECIES: neuraminidase-like domain-containing protein [Pseudomonas]|uniref:Tc toxin subunit A-related protein n=1 Tax=Pseudomonas TaxID=286 RepID=UPI001BE5A5C3|nr:MULTISPECIES: neuraminidase-like domain-containing protein [Pseudomonas]MBT2341387.1 toxin [Pseudomonas fluorescens]MCD4528971.1 toxin [Pseudomonas sp. C3-2018]
MTVAIKKQLDESLRDALLALYLNKVVPDNAVTRNLTLKTAEDLYEYWLLDVLVSQDVPTTPVACAIASLQQYIHRILMNMEPGYDSASLAAEHLSTWRNQLHQYSSWAAHQKLLYFPALYLDPLLRADKSDNFLQLENDLNQNRLQPDAVQSAVMAYLTRFEEIANLNILNGYIDGEDFANGTYYFIAKSRTENSYFWRSLNMTQRPLDGPPPPHPAPAPKLDQPDPSAWSDWEKADVPIPENAAEHTIRPVRFNSRLFVVWAECIHQDPSAFSSDPTNANAALPDSHRPLLRMSYCFKKSDGSWSTPRVGLQGYCENTTLGSKDVDAIKALIGTVAEHRRQGSHETLFLALCGYQPKTDSRITNGNDLTFIKSTCINKHLTPEPDSSPSTAAEKALTEAAVQRIQTATSTEVVFTETDLPSNMDVTMSDFEGNFEGGYRDRIHISHIKSASTLRLRMTASIAFTQAGSVPTRTRDEMRLRVHNAPHREPQMTMYLVVPAQSLPPTPYIPLSEFSGLYLTDTQAPLDRSYRFSFAHVTDALRDSEQSPGITLQSSHMNLEGKFISTDAVRNLIKVSRGRNNSSQTRYSETVTLNAEHSKAIKVEGVMVFCDEPLDKQYVVFRQPKAPKPQPLTYEDLTVVAESAPAELLPDAFEFPWPGTELNEDGATLFLGVAFVHPREPTKKLYSILKAITLKRPLKRQQPPGITQVTTPGLGTTQFIDFARSAVKKSDAYDRLRPPIRLNTVFAAELVRRAENSLDALFDLTTQHLPEPFVPGDSSNWMDFHGPYGRYFTELFLYVPWLVAQRLNTEQRYEDAERWLRHTFDPGRNNGDHWRSVPLIDNGRPSYANQTPHDPHQIALSHPVHFRKALYFLYLDILINRGDAAYRELTPDSLSEAKLWYARALDLLGPRAEVQPLVQWPRISLQTLSETSNEHLRRFEYALTNSTANHALHLLGESSSPPSLPAIDTPYLRIPFHPELRKRWDITDSRLHNLRHNLDIAGKPLHLPMFAPALDPRASAIASGMDLSRSAAPRLPNTQIPPYRFTAVLNQAQAAVESLCQFGAALLSLIERKEQAQLQELQQQHAWDLAKQSVDLHRQALNIDRHNRQALLASQAVVQGRLHHYQQLLENGLCEIETKASELYLSSGSSELDASNAQVVAGSLMLMPNIFGFSVGGSRWEGALHAAAALAQGDAIRYRTAAQNLDRTAQFTRRREDWTLAQDQARLELAQLDAQLGSCAEQETATRLQLRLAESSLNQAKANYDLLSKRFTKAQLYQWLNSQFAALYRQAYDATSALCLEAEACWQYELADFSTRFIQPGAWNTTYRGLGAGEQLKLNLLNMQAQYLRRHERELEIRRTVSLRHLKDQTPSSPINQDWTHVHAALKEGQCKFELTHELFEDDYKDQQHYLRRIKTISISLPAVVGPYENIRATLTQTASKVFLAAGDRGEAIESRRAHPQVALSTGVDDNGLFTLNFNDERYLPFEYTGAISKWQLTFPNPEKQKDLLESLTDIIVHVSYTARVGGGSHE